MNSEEWLIRHLGGWVIIVLMAGSVADFFQFLWIMKRSWGKLKRKLYNKIKREIEEREGKRQ